MPIPDMANGSLWTTCGSYSRCSYVWAYVYLMPSDLQQEPGTIQLQNMLFCQGKGRSITKYVIQQWSSLSWKHCLNSILLFPCRIRQAASRAEEDFLSLFHAMLIWCMLQFAKGNANPLDQAVRRIESPPQNIFSFSLTYTWSRQFRQMKFFFF